jgi:DNA-binding transcriptional LysR family regulator
MNLHALRIFVEVAAHRSVTRAAETLRLSQPAVTAQIRNLEKEAGLRLISPDGRGIRLTDAGEMLVRHARRLFDWEKEIESQLEQFKKGEVGKLRIAATHSPANWLLPKWLAQFKQTFPLVEIVLRTSNSRQAFEQLLHFEADIAVVAGHSNKPELDLFQLMEDELWFIVPKEHPYANQVIALTQLVKEPFLLREEGSSTREMLFSLCKIHRVSPPRIGLQFHGINEAIRSVMAGYGTTLVPSMAARDLLDRGEISRVYVSGVTIKRPIHLCTRKGDALPPVADHFLKLIKSGEPLAQSINRPR